jgi:hypothetical protein
MDKNERLLSEQITRLLKQLETLLYNSYLAALKLFQVKKSLSGDTPFWFSRNATADNQMNKLISTFNNQANALFLNGIEHSWKLGNENAIDKIRLAFSGNARQRKAFDQIRTEATQTQRNIGSQASAKRYAGGINLSDRVWNLGNGMKQEIETIVQNGMKEGKSADQLSRELNKYLNNPDALFRRVRNKETGELELSEAAKKYKPGQGVYRSSYKNAMRLARTEIAAAYRRAAWEQFQNDPRITGIRISLSNNHTCINPRTGKLEPFHDICDELAGDYPKSFLWTGWHPQCRCVMTPIVVSGDEATKLIDAKVRGEKYEPKRIKSVPSQFQKWIENNTDRIEAANNRGTLPYWIKDNAKFIKVTTSEYPYIMTDKSLSELRKLGFNIQQRAEKRMNDIEFAEKFNSGYMAKFNLQEFDKNLETILKEYDANMEIKERTLTYSEHNKVYQLEYYGLIDGKKFELHRKFTGDNTVRHVLFTLPESAEGKGLSKKIFRDLYKQYKNAGIETIEVHANLNVGGYTWGKYGFTADKSSYNELLSLAKSRKKIGMIGEEACNDFIQWLTPYKGKDIPLYEVAYGKKYGKDFLLGSDWGGYIHFSNEKTRKIFEDYIAK